MPPAPTSLERALRAVLDRSPAARAASLCNSFGLVIARVAREGGDDGGAAGGDADADAAVRFGVTADALDKLALGACASTVARLPHATLVQAALFPLVLNVELHPAAAPGDVDGVLALLPALLGVLEPVRAEAEAQTG